MRYSAKQDAIDSTKYILITLGAFDVLKYIVYLCGQL